MQAPSAPIGVVYAFLFPQKGGTWALSIKLINIGYNNFVSANRLLCVIGPESAPVKRIIQEARDAHMLIDATYGRRTRAVMIVDSGHVVLSAVQPETMAHRLDTPKEGKEEPDAE